MTLEQAVAWRTELRANGQRLAVTNGCFDLLHRGHAEYLSHAREVADALLVAINSDASVRAIKGPERPVISEQDRAFMLACLESIDAVVVFDDEKPLGLLEAIVPDVYVKGGDYTVETIVQEERRLLEGLGSSFAFIPFVAGFSTTNTIAKVRGNDAK
jgi:D-beta-D-heptose 7-phosphate kinase/D-beta-D-heptose 1-phosphate adenosyltransferase